VGEIQTIDVNVTVWDQAEHMIGGWVEEKVVRSGRECLAYDVVNNVFDGSHQKDGDQRDKSCDPRE